MGRHAVSQHAMAAKVMLGLSVLLISSAAAAGRPVEGTRLPSSSDGVASMQAACEGASCHRRNMLQTTIIPGEVNQTAADVRSTLNNATTAVSNRFNNASTGFTQLGQTSALDTAANSGNATVGDYAHAFVNDTNRALGVIGGVFKSSSGQSALSKASLVVAAATTALLLGMPLL